ncbi:hypothetical protein CC78DRAFT_620782 [Lojkania enalia]|uniref:DUF7730 domain-containing protein n=1 Tax=Lojkania enalia TaxID=147567 RepID=A0A9P4MZQ5_9PLEO|nr:hypothetical protein CC78DRAFT_620782 [Didymosphaeria enalia]
MHWWGKSLTLTKDFFWIVICSPLVAVYLVAKSCRKGIQWAMTKYDETFVQPPRKLLKEDEISNRRLERRARNAVKALPSVRPRALTLNSKGVMDMDNPGTISPPANKKNLRDTGHAKEPAVSPREETVQQITTDQVGACDFYSLPYEIRQIIWRYTLGGHHIHIVKRKGRLGNVYCAANDPMSPDHRDLCTQSRDNHGFYIPTSWPQDARPLSLITSCRQIYSETIDILYSLNMFSFSFEELGNLEIFLDNLLPHRRKQISAIHITISLIEHRIYPSRAFSRPWEKPHNATGVTWWKSCIALRSLPSLRSLTISPAFTFNNQSCQLEPEVRANLDSINKIPIQGRFSVTIPWPERAENRAWIASDNVLPQNPNFKIIRHIAPRNDVELLAFFLPFNVQCLHCRSYTIIRKTTKGLVESVVYRASADFLQRPPNCSVRVPDPVTSYYWTFHTYCGGWLEFQYDWEDKKWSVTQGAREISDEEAATHLTKCGDLYPEMESQHEKLNGLQVRLDPVMRAYCAQSGTTLDTPTKEMFYQNVGWTRKLDVAQ